MSASSCSDRSSCPPFRTQLFDSTDDVIFYPAYGVQDAGTRVWEIHMRAKVQEPRNIGRHIRRLFSDMPSQGGRGGQPVPRTHRDLVADDKSGEKVTFGFDEDASRKAYRLANGSGDFPETNGDGVVEGVIKLSDSDAQQLLAAQRSTSGWLTYRTTSGGHPGAGRLRLIGPTGLSVISDIDDTIKLTDVPAGKRTVVINTFFREFAAAQEMIANYRGYGDAAFHYVSGGPGSSIVRCRRSSSTGDTFPRARFT